MATLLGELIGRVEAAPVIEHEASRRQHDDEALAGLVLDFLLADGPAAGLKIVVVGCSNGAEAYSMASILKRSHPRLDWALEPFSASRSGRQRRYATIFIRDVHS